jgi:asparagine synthase (glutamine-hydrolysing)
VPLARWLRGPLREKARLALAGDALAASGVVDPAVVERLFAEHQSGRHDHSTPLWSVLMFDAFLRNVAHVSAPQHGAIAA